MFNPVPPQDPNNTPERSRHGDDDYRRLERDRDWGRPLDDADLSAGDWVLCILCSGIACIIGIVRLIQGKPNAGKMIGISLAFSLLWTLLRLALSGALQMRP